MDLRAEAGKHLLFLGGVPRSVGLFRIILRNRCYFRGNYFAISRCVKDLFIAKLEIYNLRIRKCNGSRVLFEFGSFSRNPRTSILQHTYLLRGLLTCRLFRAK